MNTLEMFAKDSVWKVIAKMAIPAVITITVMLLYNMADMFFVGLQNDSLQIGAISLSSPIYQILMALGTLIGAGGCSAIARTLGTGKAEDAKDLSRLCCLMAVTSGIIFAIAVLVFIPLILEAIGVSAPEPDLYNYTKNYITYFSIGAPFILVASSFSNLIRAEGSSRESMIGNGIGTVTNFILDPLFILVFHMGVSGAAIATVLGNAASCLYYVYYFRRKNTMLALQPTRNCIRIPLFWAIVSLGFPNAITNILASFSNALYNRLLISYSTEIVTAFGISGKVTMIMTMITMGICMGIQPAIAYNYGAKNRKRTMEIVKKTALVTVITGTLLTLLCCLLRHQLVSLFTREEKILDAAEYIAVIGMISGPFIGLYYLCTNFLQAAGNSLYASILSILRQGIIYIPALYLLDFLFGLNGLICTGVIVDYIVLGIGFFLLGLQYRKFAKICI